MKQSKADLLQIPRREFPLRRTPHHAHADQEVIPFHRQSVYDELPGQVVNIALIQHIYRAMF